MSKGVNVRIPEKLQAFVARQTGPDGVYENASEYVRDLIRRDYQRYAADWSVLFDELGPGMKAPESEFVALSARKIKTEAAKRMGKDKVKRKVGS